jgi:hypothetical protein
MVVKGGGAVVSVPTVARATVWGPSLSLFWTLVGGRASLHWRALISSAIGQRPGNLAVRAFWPDDGITVQHL